jgi:hypothetical protein
MPVLLKRVKKELQSDVGKVGKNADGEYKFIPPNIVGRRIRNYPKLSITKFTERVDSKEGKITFQSISASETTSTKYKLTIQFFDVSYSPVETRANSIEMKEKIGSKKETLWLKPLTYGGNPVKMRCQCMDFRHRFQAPLREEDGLFGGFIPYTRKTDPWPVGYPSVNSTNKLGICKHLSSFLAVIESEGYLKNR